MSAEAETKVKFAEDPSAPKKGGRKSSVMVNRRASKANASMVSESADESIPAIQRHRKRSVIGGMDEIDLEKRELKEKHDAERAAREASGSVDGIPEDPGLVEYYKSMDALKWYLDKRRKKRKAIEFWENFEMRNLIRIWRQNVSVIQRQREAQEKSGALRAKMKNACQS